MNSPRYQKQLAEERKALGLDSTAMPQMSMLGEQTLLGEYVDMPELEMIEEGEVKEEVVVQPKTAAQLLVEKIEREKGLRKEAEV